MCEICDQYDLQALEPLVDELLSDAMKLSDDDPRKQTDVMMAIAGPIYIRIIHINAQRACLIEDGASGLECIIKWLEGKNVFIAKSFEEIIDELNHCKGDVDAIYGTIVQSGVLIGQSLSSEFNAERLSVQ